MTTFETDPAEIDVWTTTQGRWRLAVDEWLRRRSAPPEAPYVALRDPGGPSVIDPPRPDEPCPDEVAGDAAAEALLTTPVTEVLQ